MNSKELKDRLPEIYAFLVQQMNDCGLFLLDRNGIILSWNPGIEKLLGYKEPEWLGQSVDVIYTPEDRAKDAFQAEIRAAVSTGQAADARWHLRKDGTRVLVDGVLFCIRDETGSIVCLAKQMRDATSQHAFEQKFQLIEERFRLAREGADLGIWDWDVINDKIDASETYYRILAIPLQSEPISFEKWLSLVHPWDRESVAISTRKALETGDFDAQFRVIWPDGSTHWLHAKGSVQYADNRPVRMVRVLRDITVQKASEQALRDSEARNSAILRASLDAIILMDHNGVLQEFNPAAEEMFGYSRSAVIGRPLVDMIIPPRLRQQHREGLDRHLSTGDTSVIGRLFETEAMRFDGTEFPIELAIARVPVEGNPLFAGYVRDISDRKRTMLDLQRSNRELGDFAHVVAHDLHAPLRNISSYAQLLAQRYRANLDESGHEFLALIRESAGVMQEMIDGLLRYAEAGDTSVTRERTDLNTVVSTVLMSMKSSLDEAGAELICNELPTVESNPVQVKQLFQNLISNAIKYKSQRPLRICIRARRSSDCWIVSVSDNGVGIRPEDQERIFLPLKRLHGKEIAGTGLGLSVCRAAAKSLGGRIWVESEPGVGSTFYFTMPHSSLRSRSMEANGAPA